MIEFLIIYYVVGLLVLGAFIYFDDVEIDYKYIPQLLLYALVSPFFLLIGMVIGLAYGVYIGNRDPIEEDFIEEK